MLIKKVHVLTTDLSHIVGAIRGVSDIPIMHANWTDQYSCAPETSFKIAHNGNYLFLQYNVKEKEVLAKIEHDQDYVNKDSCVKFFISFDDSPSYYTLAASCIGKSRFAYRQEGKDPQYADTQVMLSIKRYASLGSECFDRRQGDIKWSLLLVIPKSVFWMSNMKNFNGVKARANFCKCGELLSEPHFLSWNPIDNEVPNFYLPQFFGDLRFEE